MSGWRRTLADQGEEEPRTPREGPPTQFAWRRAAQRARARAKRLHRRARRRPLDYIRWLPPQHRFLSDRSNRKSYRAGNQALGKTTAGLAEIIYRCTGNHPYNPGIHAPPIEAWVICASWQQSLAIQEKLWNLLPKDEIEEGQRFDPVNGFHANNPTVRFANGSIIRFKTTKQGGLDLASATIHVAMFDEPPRSSRIYGEIKKRLMKTNGVLIMTFTPVNAPIGWLKEEVKLKRLSETHARLTPENLIPVGSSVPVRIPNPDDPDRPIVCDEAWIKGVIADTLPHEVPVVCHGEWDMRTEHATFRAYRDSGSHVSALLPEDVEFELRLGLDHGHGGRFEQIALLVAVDRRGPRPHVYVLDEYLATSETDSDFDARGILGMLARNGIEWHELDRAYGDRPYQGKQDRPETRKSNARLRRAIQQALGLRRAPLPKIDTVKTGAGHGRGSVHDGCTFLHELMVRDLFTVHPRCTRLRESLCKWQFGKDDEWKHAIDGLRYALDDLIYDSHDQRKRRPIYMYGQAA